MTTREVAPTGHRTGREILYLAEVAELVRRLGAGACAYVPGHEDQTQPVFVTPDGVYHVSEILLALLNRIEALEERANDDYPSE